MAFVSAVVAAAAAGFAWWKRSNDRADEIYQWLASTDYIRRRDHTNEASRNSMDAILVHLRAGNEYAAFYEYQGLCARVAETRLLQSELVQRFKHEFPRALIPYQLTKVVFLPTYPETSEVGQFVTGSQNTYDTQHVGQRQSSIGRTSRSYSRDHAPMHLDHDRSQYITRNTTGPNHLAEFRGRNATFLGSRPRRRSSSPRHPHRGGGLMATAHTRDGYRYRSPNRRPSSRLAAGGDQAETMPDQHKHPAWDGLAPSERESSADSESDRQSDNEMVRDNQRSTRPVLKNTTSNVSDRDESTEDENPEDESTEDESTREDRDKSESSGPQPDDALVQIVWNNSTQQVVLGDVRTLDLTGLNISPHMKQAIKELSGMDRKPVVELFYGRPRLTGDSWRVIREINHPKQKENRTCRPFRWLSAMIQATGTSQDEPCARCAEGIDEGNSMTWGAKCVKVDIDGLRCSNCEWHENRGCKGAREDEH